MEAKMLLLMPALVSMATGAQSPEAVLDAWHLAAARADADAYFGLMAPGAVFLGTDATERWTKEEFRAYAEPYFKKGKAWTFKALKRQVAYSSDGNTAWFDEDLDTANLGPARGSGVLVKQGRTWRIVQYNLSVPIPNPLMQQVKKEIQEHLKSLSKQ
ncbi:MAG: nuclear transport factor 2 family protein [Acidobacteriota bacterium]|nr:nuclear transport factor 2 family protein [Acidobacteriota bacterium]